MEETGTVVSVQNSEVTVRFERTDACKQCGACDIGQDGAMHMTMRNETGAAVGDTVTVELSENKLLLASLLAYGVPLAALVVGLILGYTIVAGMFHTDQSLTSAVIGFILMAVSFVILRVTEPARRSKGSYLPKAIRTNTEKPNREKE